MPAIVFLAIGGRVVRRRIDLELVSKPLTASRRACPGGINPPARRVLKLLLVGCLSLLLLVCGRAGLFAAEHVIHVSVDGMNASMMQQSIDAGDSPNLKRL
jgi:hypothetical protein